MNNPFDKSSHINNPFDSDPTHARNRYPDLNSLNSQQQQQQYAHNPNTWQSPTTPYGGYPFTSFGTAATPQSTATGGGGLSRGYGGVSSPYGALPSPTASFFGPAGEVVGSPRFGGMGVASGGPYSAIAPTLDTQQIPNNQYFQYGSASGGLYSPNNATPSHLTQFDPLANTAQLQNQNSAAGGIYSPGIANQGYQTYSNTAAYLKETGRLDYYPPTAANPNNLAVSGYNGSVTVHIAIRRHPHTPADHPRQMVQVHRAEMEQWGPYGWRQTLNSFENLRQDWEIRRDDVNRSLEAVGRPGSVQRGSREEMVLRAVHADAVEKIDIITAAYLQMQEVYSSFRQSSDPSSRQRVKECLNAGLRNLPDWP